MANPIVTLLGSAGRAAQALGSELAGSLNILAQMTAQAAGLDSNLGRGASSSAKKAQDIVKNFKKFGADFIGFLKKQYATVKKFYDQTVALTLELERGTRSAAVTIAANVDLIDSAGERITSVAGKIGKLTPALKQIQKELIETAPNLVGVTTEELLQTFNQVSIQFGQIAGQTEGLKKGLQGIETVAQGIQIGDDERVSNLEAAKELTISLASSMKTFGLRARDVNQEVRAILTGDIDINARLAKQLDISRKQIEAEKAKGTLVSFYLKRMEAVRKSNALFNKSLENTLSVIEDIEKGFRRAVGESAFENVEDSLYSFRAALEDNRDDINEWGKEIGQVAGPAFESMMSHVEGFVEVMLENKDGIQSFIEFIVLGFQDITNGAISLAKGVIVGISGLGQLLDLANVAWDMLLNGIAQASQAVEDFFKKRSGFWKAGFYALNTGAKGASMAFEGMREAFSAGVGYKADKDITEITKFGQAVGKKGIIGKSLNFLTNAFREIPILGDAGKQLVQNFQKQFENLADQTGDLAQTYERNFDRVKKAIQDAASPEETAKAQEELRKLMSNFAAATEEAEDALKDARKELENMHSDVSLEGQKKYLEAQTKVLDAKIAEAEAQASITKGIDETKLATLETLQAERKTLQARISQANSVADNEAIQRAVAERSQEISTIVEEINGAYVKQHGAVETVKRELEDYGETIKLAKVDTAALIKTLSDFELGSSAEVVKNLTTELKKITNEINLAGVNQKNLNILYKRAAELMKNIDSADERLKIVQSLQKLNDPILKQLNEQNKAIQAQTDLWVATGQVTQERAALAKSTLDSYQAQSKAVEKLSDLITQITTNDSSRIELLTRKDELQKIELNSAKQYLKMLTAQTAEEKQTAALQLEANAAQSRALAMKVREEILAKGVTGAEEIRQLALVEQLIIKSKIAEQENKVLAIVTDRNEKEKEYQQLINTQAAGLETFKGVMEAIKQTTTSLSNEQAIQNAYALELKQNKEAVLLAEEAMVSANEAYNNLVAAGNVSIEERRDAQLKAQGATNEYLKQLNKGEKIREERNKAIGEAIDESNKKLKTSSKLANGLIKNANKLKIAFANIKLNKIEFKLGNVDKVKEIFDKASEAGGGKLAKNLKKVAKSLLPEFKKLTQEGEKGYLAQIDLIKEKYKEEQKIADAQKELMDLERQERIADLEGQLRKQEAMEAHSVTQAKFLQTQLTVIEKIIDTLKEMPGFEDLNVDQLKAGIAEAKQSMDDVVQSAKDLAHQEEQILRDQIEFENSAQEAADKLKEQEDSARKMASDLEAGAKAMEGLADDAERAGDAPAPGSGGDDKPDTNTTTGTTEDVEEEITLNTTSDNVEQIETGRFDLDMQKELGTIVVNHLESMTEADQEFYRRGLQRLGDEALKIAQDVRREVQGELRRGAGLGKLRGGPMGSIDFGVWMEYQKQADQAGFQAVIDLQKTFEGRAKRAAKWEAKMLAREQRIAAKKAAQQQFIAQQKATRQAIREEAEERRRQANQHHFDMLKESWLQTKDFLDGIRSIEGRSVFGMMRDSDFLEAIGYQRPGEGENATEENIEDKTREALIEVYGKDVADALSPLVDLDQEIIDALNEGGVNKEDLMQDNKIFLDPTTGQLIVTGKDPDFDKLTQIFELQAIKTANERGNQLLEDIEKNTSPLSSDFNMVMAALAGDIAGVNITDGGTIQGLGDINAQQIQQGETWSDIADKIAKVQTANEKFVAEVKDGVFQLPDRLLGGFKELGINVKESSIREFGREVGEAVAHWLGENIDISEGIARGSRLGDAYQQEGVERNATDDEIVANAPGGGGGGVTNNSSSSDRTSGGDSSGTGTPNLTNEELLQEFQNSMQPVQEIVKLIPAIEGIPVGDIIRAQDLIHSPLKQAKWENLGSPGKNYATGAVVSTTDPVTGRTTLETKTIINNTNIFYADQAANHLNLNSTTGSV